MRMDSRPRLDGHSLDCGGADGVQRVGVDAMGRGAGRGLRASGQPARTVQRCSYRGRRADRLRRDELRAGDTGIFRRQRGGRGVLRDPFVPRGVPAGPERVAGDRAFDNPDAPKTPFDMPEYKNPKRDESQGLSAKAEEELAYGDEANQYGDNYGLASVFFAAVLFSTGIVTKFKNDGIRFASLAMASVALIGATAFMLTLPKLFQA